MYSYLSRRFPRKLEMFRAVLELFVQACSDFAVAKTNFRMNSSLSFRKFSFSVLSFYNMRRIATPWQVKFLTNCTKDSIINMYNL